MAIRVVEGPVIRAGESLSEPLDCTSGKLLRIIMPDGWDEPQGANKATLTFELSNDGVEWNELCDREGYEWQINTVVPNSTVILEIDIHNAHIKFRSGSCVDPIEQTADRVFKVVVTDLAVGSGGGSTPQPPSGSDSDSWVWVYSHYYGWVLMPPGGGGKPQPPGS